MARNIILALDAKAALGECPRWHGGEARLYWVDIARRELHRFDPATGLDEARTFDAPVGCFAFMADGGLMLGMKAGFARLADWDAQPEPWGRQFLADRPDLRMNDGRVDPVGRFWAGSVNMAKSAHDAALYCLTGHDVREVQGGMLTCNGAAFSADGHRFFHADTPSHALRSYDCDPVSGALSGETVIHQWPMGHGRPDGGSVDVEGNYWTALFDGGRVARLSPDGAILEEVVLPTKRPTMIALGGADGRTAYVTTASDGLDADTLAAQPHAGDIFTFRVDAPGVPEWRFAG